MTTQGEMDKLRKQEANSVKTRPGDLVVPDIYGLKRNKIPKSHYWRVRSQVDKDTPKG